MKEILELDVRHHVPRLLRCVEDQPDLGTSEGFTDAWHRLQMEVCKECIFPKDVWSAFHRDGCIKLVFGLESVKHETNSPTPTRRRVGQLGINEVSSYLALAIAVQAVQHQPHMVCNVHSFEQVYGGRLFTDIIPEAEHTTFDGTIRAVNHTQEIEKAMRLHADDADLLFRAPMQLLAGIKNCKRTQTIVALVPSDEMLQQHGIETQVLRQDRFQHIPPALVKLGKGPPPQPVLFGPKAAPGIQADRKNTRAVDEEAQQALNVLFDFLEKPENQVHVEVAPGDVVVLDNLRALHGRAPLQPVESIQQRRWVKRLWLSSTEMDRYLATCRDQKQGHCRVFDRQKALEEAFDLGWKHPWQMDCIGQAGG